MVSVFISQVCDVGNKGDQAILKSEISLLRRLFPEAKISVSTLWSRELLKRVEPTVRVHSPLVDLKFANRESPLLLYPVVIAIQFLLSILSALFAKANLPPFYRASTIRDIQAADIVISSGHEPFMEGSIYKRGSMWLKGANLFVIFWGVIDILVAKKIFNKPFTTFPQSAGPFRTFLGRLFAKFIFNSMDVICLREDLSADFLEKLGVRTPVFALADMAFLFEGYSRHEYQFRHPLIGVSPCFCGGMTKAERENYVLVLSKTLDYLVAKYGVNVIFLPSQTTSGRAMMKEKRPDDFVACSMILQKMLRKEKAEILSVQSVEEFDNVIGKLDLLIATRMHPSILASTKSIPFVAITYEHKQIGLLSRLGVSDVGIDVNHLSFEQLRIKTEYVWNERDNIRSRLLAKVPLIQWKTRVIMEQLIQSLLRTY